MRLTCRLASIPVRRSLHGSCSALAGHNKWSKIKDKKGASDMQKSLIYGKANSDIIQAVRQGGSVDPMLNTHLAAVLKRVKEQGVPKENIARSLARASLGKDKGGQHTTYEALVCNTVGVIIECMTDNPTRTLHTVRDILKNHGARLAPVKFMFNRKGSIRVALDTNNATVDDLSEKLFEAALNAGADNFVKASESAQEVVYEITCSMEEMASVVVSFSSGTSTGQLWRLLSNEIVYSPVEVSESSDENAQQLAELVGDLQSIDETIRVWMTTDSGNE